jgi:hypothetical protein
MGIHNPVAIALRRHTCADRVRYPRMLVRHDESPYLERTP